MPTVFQLTLLHAYIFQELKPVKPLLVYRESDQMKIESGTDSHPNTKIGDGGNDKERERLKGQTVEQPPEKDR